MRISCFCGTSWEVAEDHATCPLCGEPAHLPRIAQSDVDAMFVELQTILDEHGMLS